MKSLLMYIILFSCLFPLRNLWENTNEGPQNLFSRVLICLLSQTLFFSSQQFGSMRLTLRIFLLFCMSSLLHFPCCLYLDSLRGKRKLSYDSVPEIEDLPLLGLFPLIGKDTQIIPFGYDKQGSSSQPEQLYLTQIHI